MTAFHSLDFAARRKQLTLAEQLGNIGSEVDRAIARRRKGHPRRSNAALDRALDLFDPTISDPRWRTRSKLKELTRAREALCEAFCTTPPCDTSLDSLSRYFYYFAWAARLHRQRRDPDSGSAGS
ncbi:MAG: hypothetical protein FJW35_06925 [Acidobacteria bacterium]|nr:hypothetical protein [Acidobacteriota bacterium]